MSLEFLNFGIYNLFVWSAFFFTFVCCFNLLLLSKRELKNQEKIYFNEFKEERNITSAKVKKLKEKEVLFGNLTF